MRNLFKYGLLRYGERRFKIIKPSTQLGVACTIFTPLGYVLRINADGSDKGLENKNKKEFCIPRRLEFFKLLASAIRAINKL